MLYNSNNFWLLCWFIWLWSIQFYYKKFINKNFKSGNYISKIMISDEEVCKVNNDECVIGAFYMIDYNLWGI